MNRQFDGIWFEEGFRTLKEFVYEIRIQGTIGCYTTASANPEVTINKTLYRNRIGAPIIEVPIFIR